MANTSSRKLPYAVRNWKDFQHYKNRTPPWIKLHRTLLDDRDYYTCDPLAAKCLPLLWLIASEYDGRLPEVGELAFRLRITDKQCLKVISDLASWVYQDASDVLAGCKQDATLEEEGEGETDKEAETEIDRDKRGPLIAFGEFKKVKLSEAEYQKLCDKHGKQIADAGIGELDAWMERTGKKRKNHYACLSEAGWVWEKVGGATQSGQKSWTNFGTGGL